MTIRSALQLKRNLEVIQGENAKKLAALDAVYYDRLSRGLDLTQIKKDMEQAKTIAEKSEELAAKALKVAEDRELVQAEAAEKNQQRVSAELENRQKVKAEHAWLAAGGDPKQFESSWPIMREELLKQAVISQANAP